MTKTITITDLSEVRAGDLCIVEIGGRQYTGPAYARVGGILDWGGHALRYPNGEPGTLAAFVSATREAPTLPTKAGSVILVHEADGKVCDPPVLAVNDGTELVPWNVVRPIGGYFWFSDEDITRWQACEITPEGPVIGQ